MFELDPHAGTPLSEQLAARLRFLIAVGHYRPGDTLPSTRRLGTELGISFHTVRKAYSLLAAEGTVGARPGRGFVVRQRAAPPLADRMERGAEIVHDMVQRLIGLGLSEEEVSHLVDERLAFLESDAARPKLIFAAPFLELAELGATQIASAAHQPASPVRLQDLSEQPDADVIVVPHASYQAAAHALPQAQVVGVALVLHNDVLAGVSRLLPNQTLGLITRDGEAIGPLLRVLRSEGGFTGPALALEADAERERLQELIEEVALLVFTPQARRRLRTLAGDARSVELTLQVEPRSLEAVVAALR